MTELRITNLSADVGGVSMLKGVSTSLKTGELTALVGPNGAGKTSLLKCAIGLIRPTAGTLTIGGDAMANLAPDERARRIAYLPQQRPLAWPLRVRDLVALGRFAYGTQTGKMTAADTEIIDRAVADCDLTALADRHADRLSGGELARAHVARAFAADAPLLLADEPIAALDPRQQLKVLSLIRRFVDQGGGAMMVLHDLALAAQFADRLIWMKDGAIVADGPAAETLTPARMREVFRVEATISLNGDTPSVTLTDSA